MEGPGLLVVHVNLKRVIFITKRRSQRHIFEAFFTWTESITKFIQKMLVLNVNRKQRED